MPTNKKDRGGEDRDKANSEDAVRAARRAARDKAFGKTSPPASELKTAQEQKKSDQEDPGQEPLGELFGRSQKDDFIRGRDDENESRHGEVPKVRGVDNELRSGKRRELPMAGSASEVRRLRRGGPDLAAMLELIKCDAMAADIVRKKRLLYGSMILVGIAIVVFFVAQYLGLRQVVYFTKFSILAAPICLGFAINDICMRIARTNPKLACRILSFLTFGNANSLRSLAHLYMDQGDYAKAEKTLSASIGAIDPKRKLRDYILMHALFANLRAHIGRSTEAEQLVREVLNAAEAHDKERQTNYSAFLLANTLNYAAQLCDVTDKMHDALALARRAVKLLCDHDMPPPDITLVALYNAGYYCNVLGEFQEAMVYLTKAEELATKTGIARDGELAFIFSNLAIANLGVGRSTQCKRLLNDAETRAMMPLGMSERPHTYQCWAIYHFANDRLEYSLQSYEKAIDYCSQQTPKESVFLLRIIKEYSVLLREIGKTREANANEKKVTQIRDTLHTMSAYVPTKKDKKIKPLKVPVTKKARFPIFYLLLAGFLGFTIWEEGVRLAPFSQWFFFLITLAVIAIKLRAKYGPPIREETSQGAVIAVVSLIPGLRSVVPELSLIPKRTGALIIGSAVAMAMFVQLTEPSPDMVPDSGLLGQEYLVLGDGLVNVESFNNARKAYELAAQNGAGPIAKMKLIRDLPKNEQPEDAIVENMKALEVSKEKGSKPEKARILWEQCAKKYPDFEFPYVHLAALTNPNQLSAGVSEALTALKTKKSGSKKSKSDDPISPADTTMRRSERRAKAHEAEELIQKALVINPNLGIALLEMCSIKNNLGDTAGRIKYAKKYLEVTGDSDIRGRLIGESLVKMDSDDVASASPRETSTDPETTKSSDVVVDDTSKPARKSKLRSAKELKEFDERFSSTTEVPEKKLKPVESAAEEDELEEMNSTKPGVMKRFEKSTIQPSNKNTQTAKPVMPSKTNATTPVNKPVSISPQAAKPTARSQAVPNKPMMKPAATHPAVVIPKSTATKSTEKSKKKRDDSWMKLSPDDTDW
jgi:tetratricopeptide (TPR) repeat protein